MLIPNIKNIMQLIEVPSTIHVSWLRKVQTFPSPTPSVSTKLPNIFSPHTLPISVVGLIINKLLNPLP